MNKRAIAIIFAILTLISCQKINTEKVSKNLYKDEGENFKINFFNQEPYISSKDINSEFGLITIFDFQLLVETSDFKSSYVVSFNDYPEDILGKVSKQKLIDGNLSYGFKNKGFSKFDWAKEVEIKNGYGKRVGASANFSDTKYSIVYQAFLVDNRLYQIGLFKEKKPITDKEISAFFDSFVLIEKNIKKDIEKSSIEEDKSNTLENNID